MHPRLQASTHAIGSPEVQAALALLAQHGLAASMPHEHDSEGNTFPLAPNRVQLEEDGKVTFMEVDEFRAIQTPEHRPVAWRFNPETGNTEAWAWCVWD